MRSALSNLSVGVGKCTARRTSRWSRLRDTAEEFSPRFTVWFFPRPSSVKSDMWSGTCDVRGGWRFIEAGGISGRLSGAMRIYQCKPTHTRIHPHNICPYGNLQLWAHRGKTKSYSNQLQGSTSGLIHSTSRRQQFLISVVKHIVLRINTATA